MKRLLFCLAITFLFAGCNDEEYQRAKRMYEVSCAEASTVPFEQMKLTTGQCNGLPVLFEMTKVLPGYESAYPAIENAFKVYAEHRPLDLVEPRTGRTLLMHAIINKNYRLAAVIYKNSKNPNAVDANGRSYLHYLADQIIVDQYFWREEDRMPWEGLMGGAAAEVRDRSGQTPAERAYQMKNWDVLWQLLGHGARADFLLHENEIDSGFVFHFMADYFPTVFDRFPGLVTKAYSGVIYESILPEWAQQRTTPRRVQQFTLARFASEHCLTNLALYLGDRRFGGREPILLQCSTSGFSAGLMNKYMNHIEPVENQTYFHDDDFSPNAMKQTLAHTYLYLVPSSQHYKELPGLPTTAGLTNFIQLLNERIGDWNQPDAMGFTPLHMWLANPERKMPPSPWRWTWEAGEFKKLLSNSKNHEQLTINGDSILTFAVRSGRLYLVKTLLSADLSMVRFIAKANREGKTPLTEANELGFKDIYAYLQKYH